MPTYHYYLPLPLPYRMKKELREKGIAGNRRKKLKERWPEYSKDV
jgi:hypothetical protein